MLESTSPAAEQPPRMSPVATQPQPPRVAIDLRPLPIVLLARTWRWLAFAVLAGVLWGICAAPTPEGLTPEGQRALGVFVVCVTLWVTHLLPLMVTGLLALVLLPLLGVLPAEAAFAVLGNPAVLFILGAFMLAAAMVQSGLSERLALRILDAMGGSPERLALGILLGAAFLSFWMPEHAVAAMLLPVALQVSHTLKLRHGHSAYARQLFLALAWGSVIGGVATLLGGARAPLALALLHDYTATQGLAAETIGFADWTLPILPVVLVLLCVAAVFLRVWFPSEVDSVAPARDALRAAIRRRGRPTWRERGVGLVVASTVLAWIVFGHDVGLAPIALAAAVTLFLLRLVTWESVEAYVNWGIILMYGGAIALGTALAQTGGAIWVAQHVFGGDSLAPFLLLVALALAAILLTEGMSNSAVVALLMPVALTLGHDAGVPLRLVAYAIAVPAGLAFCLPTGTPPNAIAFASGYLRLRDVLLPGILLNVTSWLVFVAAMRWYWPLIGLEVGP